METDKEVKTVSGDKMQQQEELLRGLLHKIAKERGFANYTLDIKPTSSEGANYTSVLFYATISSDNGDVRKLFAKVACVGENMRAIAPYKIYDTEKIFYTDLINTYKRLEDKHNVPQEDRFVTPEFYGLNFEYLKEVFVMEDLTFKGYQMFDRFTTVDWNYTKEAMKQLAKLHALSMAYSIELPEEFEEKTKDLKMHVGMAEMKVYMADMIPKIIECVKEEYKERINRFFTETLTEESTQRMVLPIKRTVLAHGDYRPSNLMHKQNVNGTYSVIPIDYQTLNRSNPIVDILYFIFIASDQKFRAEYYQKTLDHYYAELCTALRHFQINPDDVYPREDFDFELKETTIIIEHKNILHNIIDQIAKEQHYKNYQIVIKPMSTEGANYSSKLYVATVSEDGNKKLELFAKVAAIGGKLRSLEPFRIYETEFNFYTKLIKRYGDIERKHNVPEEFRYVVPKLYGYSMKYMKETLVFENLLTKGYQMYDRFKTIDWDYASASLSQLAKLHGLSMAYSFEYPEEFKRDTELMKLYNTIDELIGYLESVISKVLRVTKDVYKDRLRKFLDGVTSIEYFTNVLKPMRSGVFAHLDYRPSNLLHKVDENGKLHVIPVDYQTLSYGNVVSDVVYFIFIGSDQEFRRKYYQKCLNHYYSELSATLARLDLDSNKIYSRDDFEYELKEASSYGLLSAIQCLLIVTVDPKDAPKVHEHIRQEDFAVNPNELYIERINGVIEDFVKLGFI